VYEVELRRDFGKTQPEPHLAEHQSGLIASTQCDVSRANTGCRCFSLFVFLLLLALSGVCQHAAGCTHNTRRHRGNCLPTHPQSVFLKHTSWMPSDLSLRSVRYWDTSPSLSSPVPPGDPLRLVASDCGGRNVMACLDWTVPSVLLEACQAQPESGPPSGLPTKSSWCDPDRCRPIIVSSSLVPAALPSSSAVPPSTPLSLLCSFRDTLYPVSWCA
jgi:hypothetical protein